MKNVPRTFNVEAAKHLGKVYCPPEHVPLSARGVRIAEICCPVQHFHRLVAYLL